MRNQKYLMISKKDIKGLRDLADIKRVFRISEDLKAYSVILETREEGNCDFPLCSGNESKWLNLLANGKYIYPCAFGLKPIKRCDVLSLEVRYTHYSDRNYLVAEKAYFKFISRRKYKISSEQKHTYQGVGTSRSSWRRRPMSETMRKAIKCLFHEERKGRYGISLLYEGEVI